MGRLENFVSKKTEEWDKLEGQADTWQVLRLLRPFFKQLAVLSLASIGLSFLSGITQVTLTPLLEIVLNNSQDTVQQAVTTNTGFTFDLNQLGLSILGLVSKLTGYTDPWSLLLVSAGAYLFLAVLGEVLAFIARYWGMRLQVDITDDLTYRLFNHVMRLPLSYLNRFQTGWLQSRISSDIRVAARMLNDMIIDSLSSALLSVFYAFLLIRTNFRLAIIAALAGLVHIGISRVMKNFVKTRTRAERATLADFSALTQERLSAVREVKAMAAEEFEQNAFRESLKVSLQAGLVHSLIKRVEAPARWIVNRLVIITVMLFGAWELLHEELTTSAFLLFMFFSQSLIDPLAKLASTLVSLDMVSASLEMVANFLARPQESYQSGNRVTDQFVNEIRLDNVSFAYDDDSANITVLKNIDLTVKRGEMVALVGRSGAGKSTLVDLIMRFFEPTEGQILLDDIPVTEYKLQSYRRLFGVVSQDAVLFDDTIYNNIGYARPNLTHDDIIEAARIANAEEFILGEMPEQYETRLGERGVRLSGGQRQRLAIARAVAHKPEILILDEATSSLDTESERLVQAAIARVIEGSTAIVIAHRLSTIQRADKIVVLKEGRIVEAGSHEELLAQGGEYSYLHSLQFRDASEPLEFVSTPDGS